MAEDVFIKQDKGTGWIGEKVTYDTGGTIFGLLDILFNDLLPLSKKILLNAKDPSSDMILEMNLITKLLSLLNNGIGFVISSNPGVKVLLPGTLSSGSVIREFDARTLIEEILSGKNQAWFKDDLDMDGDKIWIDGVKEDSTVHVTPLDSTKRGTDYYVKNRMPWTPDDQDASLELDGDSVPSDFMLALINSDDIPRDDSVNLDIEGDASDGDPLIVTMRGVKSTSVIMVTLVDEDPGGTCENFYVHGIVEGGFQLTFIDGNPSEEQPKFCVSVWNQSNSKVKAKRSSDDGVDITPSTGTHSTYTVETAGIKETSKIIITFSGTQVDDKSYCVQNIQDGSFELHFSSSIAPPSFHMLIIN